MPLRQFSQLRFAKVGQMREAVPVIEELLHQLELFDLAVVVVSASGLRPLGYDDAMSTFPLSQCVTGYPREGRGGRYRHLSLGGFRRTWHLFDVSQ